MIFILRLKFLGFPPVFRKIKKFKKKKGAELSNQKTRPASENHRKKEGGGKGEN